MLLAEHGLDEAGVSLLCVWRHSPHVFTCMLQFYKGSDPLQLERVRRSSSLLRYVCLNMRVLAVLGGGILQRS